MRRVNVWVLVPAVLLALGVGLLVGRASKDDSETASDRSASVRSTTSTTEDTTTTSTEDTTTTTTSAPGSTTTTTAAPGAARTTTTVRASAPATQTSTATTISPATTTPGATTNSACGPGTAGASAHLVVTGSGPPTSPTYTYSGPVKVTNNTGKAIELTALVIRLTSEDGTVEDVAVSGATGTVINNGESKDIPFSYSTSHPPKDQGGTSLAKFSYKPPGGTTNCAST